MLSTLAPHFSGKHKSEQQLRDDSKWNQKATEHILIHPQTVHNALYHMEPS